MFPDDDFNGSENTADEVIDEDSIEAQFEEAISDDVNPIANQFEFGEEDII